jgi:hypothetical protein
MWIWVDVFVDAFVFVSCKARSEGKHTTHFVTADGTHDVYRWRVDGSVPLALSRV